MRVLAAMPERHARFREEKILAALAQPLVSIGTLYYRRPGHLEKLTVAPKWESLILDAGRLTLTAEDQPPQVLDIASYPEVRALVGAILGTLEGNLPELQRAYNLSLAGDLTHWQLTLTPRDARLAQLVRRVTISGAGAQPSAIRTEQANGDDFRMAIESQR
jgi:hypothetical protein